MGGEGWTAPKGTYLLAFFIVVASSPNLSTMFGRKDKQKTGMPRGLQNQMLHASTVDCEYIRTEFQVFVVITIKSVQNYLFLWL